MPAFYPLIQPAPPSVLSGSTLLSPPPVNANAAFLGFGLLSPFRRDLKQDFANAGGVELIKSCVAQILGTQCAYDGANVQAQGELLWRPAFGALLYRLRHMKQGPTLNELARVYVVDALARWEPRVSVTSSTTVFGPLQRALIIDLVYDVIQQNVPGNAVVLQDVQQTVNIPLAA